MEHCGHIPMDTERRRLAFFFATLAEDLADGLAKDLVECSVGFLAECSANLVELVGSLVAVVGERLLWVLSC